MEAIHLPPVAGEAREHAVQIEQDAGVDFADCYQCGKCTAGCPLAHAMDLVPRQVIRALQLGRSEAVLNARSPWICASCQVCSVRCPQGIDVSAIMLSARRLSKNMGRRPLRDADVFDDAFVGNIRSFGKSNEAILAAKYNLLSGHLFQDVLNAPKMAARGMIGPKIHHVADRAAVRRLVDRCLEKPKRGQAAPTDEGGSV